MTLKRFLLPLLVMWGLCASVQAHPFGSQYFAHQLDVRLAPGTVSLEYMTEVPTSVIFREFYLALSGAKPSPEQDLRFTREKVQKLWSGLELTVDGQPAAWVDLTPADRPNGRGNQAFFVFRLNGEARFTTQPGQQHRLRLQNQNYLASGAYYSVRLQASSALKVKDANLWHLPPGEVTTDAQGIWTADPQARHLEVALQTVSLTGGPPIPVTAPSMHSEADQHLELPFVSDVPLLEYLAPRELSPWLIFLALGAAFFFGAAHALSPGHGKTLVAAWLVGARGTVRHAILLGVTVTIAHTASVILLGVATLFASQYIVPERLTPILSLISGLGILSIGAFLVRDRWRARGVALTRRVRLPGGEREKHAGAGAHGHAHDHEHGHEHPHDHDHGHPHDHEHGHEHPHDHDHGHEHPHDHGHPHDHDHGHEHPHGHDHGHPHYHEHGHDHPHEHGHPHDHDHGHEHPHDHDHGHEHPHDHEHGHDHRHAHGVHSHWGEDESHVHALPESASMGELIRLGVAGGLVPCPTATVVLLAAIALGRVAFGLLLVVAFSLGLAAVLVALGIALVLFGGWLNRFSGSSRALRYLPIISALIVLILGGALSAQALQQLAAPPPPSTTVPQGN